MKYFRVENFLHPSIRNDIFEFALGQESEFVQSGVTTKEANFRASRVLYNFPKDLFVEQIKKILPLATESLELQSRVGLIECQLTASVNGDFFKAHVDNSNHVTKSRFLSYVYYFHQIPKPFLGGQLVIYDTKEKNSYSIIEPTDNSLILFNSCLQHEVLPVRCPSEKFADSRFTVNGWFSA